MYSRAHSIIEANNAATTTAASATPNQLTSLGSRPSPAHGPVVWFAVPYIFGILLALIDRPSCFFRRLQN